MTLTLKEFIQDMFLKGFELSDCVKTETLIDITSMIGAGSKIKDKDWEEMYHAMLGEEEGVKDVPDAVRIEVLKLLRPYLVQHFADTIFE